MRYIGGKRRLLKDIAAVIEENTSSVNTVMDIFAGTGVVSAYLKSGGYTVLANDFLYFSYVLQKCHIELNAVPDFSRVGGDPIAVLNALDTSKPPFPPEKCFIYNQYSPAGSERMYFQPENALKIDLIRLTIEDWYRTGKIGADGYYYLLTALIEAVPYVANIAGVYAAYLKFWEKRTFRPLVLRAPVITDNHKKNICLNVDYTEALKYTCDLLYADPPYNSREYLPNYHILETIARYDYPQIHGVTGMRAYETQKSDFCARAKVAAAFETLIRDCRARYVLISYNNEGLLDTERLAALCERYAVPGSFCLYEFDYRRYKNKIPNHSSGLKEQLYFFQKRL